ncbi:hypothetical protein A3F66_04685 [candidate division TM6 bacterium RIFCSPHIGHO2_12_FULL_32_22]|nr:MAG: hypothetical protein A3F66_04685 [candidate division TM6 bacterium RIFCSPHIGHO2_12_FULL_32_22]
MNIKDLILPIAIGVLGAFTIRYFLNNQPDESQTKSYVAPKIEEINRPLQFGVDFVNSDINLEQKFTSVETQFAKFTFSTLGATLDKVEFKHEIGNETILLTTLDQQQQTVDKCFLVAFPGETTLNYKLIDQSETDDVIKLSYESSDKSIIKNFIVYKEIPKLDLEINLKTKKETRLRLLFNSPSVPTLKDDIIQGIVDETNLVKKSVGIAKEGRYWSQPALFGSEDKYFVHAMAVDHDKFAQRGYYKVNDTGTSIVSILETPKIESDSSWTLTFYFGPKKVELMKSVNPKLGGSLEFGWWEFLCLPLLKLLNWLCNYVKNYGIAIILLTLLIKLLILPFTIRSQRGIQKMTKSQKELQQKMQHLEQKYRNDPERLREEKAELVKKHGLQGMGGCLTMLLIQPLVFFPLQRVLANAIELYKAPFLWIPNLSMPDPYYILPILVGIGMVWMTTSSSGQKKSLPSSKISGYLMPLVFAAVTVSFSAGLSLYIAVSTLLSALQNVIVNKFQKI